MVAIWQVSMPPLFPVASCLIGSGSRIDEQVASQLWKWRLRELERLGRIQPTDHVSIEVIYAQRWRVGLASISLASTAWPSVRY